MKRTFLVRLVRMTRKQSLQIFLTEARTFIASGGRRRRSLRVRRERPVERKRLVGSESIRDPPLLQIIWCHFHSHPVAWEDVHPVDAHATGQVAEQLMILGLWAEDLHLEGGIGEGFHHQSDEFYDILRHKGQVKGNALRRAAISYKAMLSTATLISVFWARSLSLTCNFCKMFY